MSVYYNEIDPYCAEWLRNLIAAGELPDGDVDERSIEDVAPADVAGYTQCHWFCGLGGWPLALRLAGWPESRTIWTGSCPCQPYSAAGKRGGDDDPRALWWAWRWLIDQCRPVTIAGEQVASAAGREWLAGVRADLDLLGYAFGAADLPAAGVGAPHARQRLWWVADTGGERRQQERAGTPGDEGEDGWRPEGDYVVAGDGEGGRLGDADNAGLEIGRGEPESEPAPKRRKDAERSARLSGGACGLAKPDGWGRQEQGLSVRPARQDEAEAVERGLSFWRAADWIPCADGKARRIEPGIEPLVTRLPGHVDQIRALGNSVVPQEAAEFLMAYMETR